MPNEPIIEIADLELRYRDLRAVAGLSLTIDAREVFGLLGPNVRAKPARWRVSKGCANLPPGACAWPATSCPMMPMRLNACWVCSSRQRPCPPS